MKTVFDIGMYDGADTAYYLECGYRVVAVEANASLVADAEERFGTQIAAGQLTCVNAAISPDGRDVELAIAGADPGSSSIYGGRIAHKSPAGTVPVRGATLAGLFEAHGVPDFLKVDIEGADRLCILPLTEARRPAFLSFEVGDDAPELLSHLGTIGYRRFRIINQNSFRELASPRRYWYERRAHRLMRRLGYRGPLKVRRAGRFFVIGHSSGPVPWATQGPWRALDDTERALVLQKASLHGRDWYDIHAAE